ADGCFPVLRHHLRPDRWRSGNSDRDHNAVHVPARFSAVAGRKGICSRHHHAHIGCRDHRDLQQRFAARLRERLMKTRRTARLRNQTLLFIGLVIFTFVNLVPLIWAALTSVKNPADAFTVPPTIFFQPTMEYHREVWVDRGFVHYLINSLIVSAGTVL